MTEATEQNSSAPATQPCPKCLGIGFTTIKATTTVAEQYLPCDCAKGPAFARAYGPRAQSANRGEK